MEDYGKTLHRLQSQCSKREYCSSEIFKKALTAFDGDREAAGKLLSSLIEDKFVDDLRYSSAFAREKSRLSGWGPVKISYALSGKGVPKATIQEALEDIDQDEAERKMNAVLLTKSRSLKGDPQERLKLIKFGLTRGYDYDNVAKAVEDVLKAVEKNP